MPSTPHYAAATAILAGSASAFVAPAQLGLASRHCRSPAVGAQGTRMVLVDKPGTGKNRMTETKFDQPLVEKKQFPGTIHGYQVCGDLLSLVLLPRPRFVAAATLPLTPRLACAWLCSGS